MDAPETTTTGWYLALLRDGLGLPIRPDDLDRDLDDVPGWDSVLMLKLIGELESATGRTVNVPAVLRARSFREIRELVGAA